eukprot:8801253-Lingulodinium_polyedra.AAC.1
MSACVLEAKYLDEFERLMQSAEFRREKRIAELRQETFRTPTPTSRAQLEALAVWPVWARGQPAMPEWATEVAHAREYFQNTVFVAEGPTGERQYWKFLYAVITPAYLAFTPLVLKEEYLEIQE